MKITPYLLYSSALLVLFLGLFPTFSYPCSNLSLKNQNQSFHAQNYDWDVDTGLVIFNPSSKIKKGIGPQPAEWVSKYSSITFNQYGYEFPIGGMNDQGLVVGVMWLNETRFSTGESDKPLIEPLQWVQYQLDNFATIEDVKTHVYDIEIRPVFGAASPLHFLVSDKKGKSCVVTLKDGQTTIYVDETLPFPVLTNTPYDECALLAANYAGLGGERAIPQSYGSVDRFVRASSFTKAFDTKEATALDVIDYLDRLSQPNYTVWSIAYNKKDLAIHFKTNQNKNVRSIAFSNFENDCAEGAMFIDMNASGSGNLAGSFTKLTSEDNLNLVRTSMAETTRIGMVPEKMLYNLAGYPFTLKCEEQVPLTSGK